MTVASQQNEVFNRTMRVEIPFSFIERSVEPGRIFFKGLRHGKWDSLIDQHVLADAVLYVDIHSLLLWKRATVSDSRQAFEPAWEGCSIEVPKVLTNGDHRVRLQVTIAYPSEHSDAGRIIARSSEIVLFDGPDPSGGSAASLLPVSPALDQIPELARLAISESAGPMLHVNSSIAGISWKELASDPRFKLAVFPDCVREVLRYLVVHAGCRSTWGSAWLELDGIRGRDIPELEGKTLSEAWQDVNDYVNTASEGFMEQLQLGARLGNALAQKGRDNGHQ